MISQALQRQKMVETQLITRGIRDERVLRAFLAVPREVFVPKKLLSRSYEDTPLPIGYSQTISQPYIVALMTELIGAQPGDRVLEIGTGSGYQAAILAELAKEVWTIEQVEPLFSQAEDVLHSLHYGNLHCICSDGSLGWKEGAPYDKIVVTAASQTVCPSLLEQLKNGGKLVIPLGDLFSQDLCLFTKDAKGEMSFTRLLPVCFVPLIGEQGWKNAF